MKRTVPLLPLAVAFQVLVTLAPPGRVVLTVQPVVPVEPAVTRTEAVKPPFHWFTVTLAEQPLPPAGGVVGVAGGVVGVAGGVVGVAGGVVGGVVLSNWVKKFQTMGRVQDFSPGA